MLELHYPTVTKTILERQYSGKPTSKVAFGNGNGAIFENSSKLRASLFVTSRWPRSSGQTNYQVHPPRPVPYKAYTLRGCAAGQDMVYHLSVPKGIWFRESLSTGYFLHDWFDLRDEFCLFSKYTKVMTVMYHALLQLPINGLKQDCVHFVLCPNLRLIKLRVLS